MNSVSFLGCLLSSTIISVLGSPGVTRNLLRAFAICLAAVLWPASGLASTTVLVRFAPGITKQEVSSLVTQWKQSNPISRVAVLANGRAEKEDAKPLMGALVVLEFTKEADRSTWWGKAIKEVPSSTIVREADVISRSIASAASPSKPFFVVNLYTPTVSRGEYIDFANGYLTPLYEAQLKVGNLIRYTVYFEHGAVGECDSVAVLEYRDYASYTSNPPEKTKIREQLTLTVPSYAKYHPVKDALRKDVGHTIFDSLEVASGN